MLDWGEMGWGWGGIRMWRCHRQCGILCMFCIVYSLQSYFAIRCMIKYTGLRDLFLFDFTLTTISVMWDTDARRLTNAYSTAEHIVAATTLVSWGGTWLQWLHLCAGLAGGHVGSTSSWEKRRDWDGNQSSNIPPATSSAFSHALHLRGLTLTRLRYLFVLSFEKIGNDFFVHMPLQ